MTLLRLHVDALHLREDDLDVFLVAEDFAQRPGDVGGREAGRGHLIEQRLEEVVVAAVDERHVHLLALELLDGFQPAEAAADDDDARAAGARPARRASVRGGLSGWAAAGRRAGSVVAVLIDTDAPDEVRCARIRSSGIGAAGQGELVKYFTNSACAPAGAEITCGGPAPRRPFAPASASPLAHGPAHPRNRSARHARPRPGLARQSARDDRAT